MKLVLNIPYKMFAGLVKIIAYKDTIEAEVEDTEEMLPIRRIPEGTGRLIDADAYLASQRPEGISDELWCESTLYKSITAAPTIIEANSGQRI